jgi:putative component of toxin-antitoxin plasmid stabilization module
MANYSLNKIELDNGLTNNIFKLEINDKCEFDEFCESLKKSGNGKVIGRIFATIKSLEEGLKLIPKKLEPLTRDKGDNIIDFRIRVGDYRVYFFRDIAGNVIVLGGNKKTQPKDIQKTRNIKKNFINATHK